ncbi:MAG TPA: hypothetical protein PLO69_11065 [Gammaproteobacteria bacterium]|nr:hypothetical protein [Gammaproteobacteria bacterium]
MHITVKPGGPDRRVPIEGYPGTYFAPGEERTVRLTPFVQRLLDDKDLVEVPDTSAAAVKE